MPNLTSHVSLALATANEVDLPSISNNMGSYLLGATAPDIRIITKQSRELTHYSGLDSTVLGDGVERLLSENKEILDSGVSTPATQAFISGYITHLISDQTWIMTMYKPYFGNRGIFPSETLANIWDRALQLEMDRQDRPVWEYASSHLISAAVDVSVPFISPDDLTKWNEWINEYATGSFSWDRLRSLARRQTVTDEAEVEQSVEDFLSNIPAGLERILSYMELDNIETYKSRAISRSVESLENFWELRYTA